MKSKLAVLLVCLGVVSMINLIIMMSSIISKPKIPLQFGKGNELIKVIQQNAELGEQVRKLKEVEAGWNERAKGEEPADSPYSEILQKVEDSVSKLGRKLTLDLNRKLFEPSHEYEKTRRRIGSGVEEIWYYVRSQFQQLGKSIGDKNIQAKIDQILEFGRDQHGYIMADIYNLGHLDGYSSWRQRELKELSNLVQQRLFYLQNPKDCSSAKKIVCNFKVECGFGCQVHHLSYCMIMAYGTGRTLILHSKGWSYSKAGWEKLFLPLSETCLDDSGKTIAKWGDPSSNEKVQVLELPVVREIPQNDRPDFVPLAIPEDISQSLMRLHGYPFLWWIGQIMKYIIRPQPDITEYIKNKTAAVGYTHPIVGIHVRRTDKIHVEAKYHGIEEYMVYAEEFYRRLERRQEVPVRRIYLATDEEGLLEEARKKYPNYVFLRDNTISKTAVPSSRYSEDSLKGLLTDISLLTQSDFLVCTFSSNVGRLAYEMMQCRDEDAAAKALTVDMDKQYFFFGDKGHEQTALYEHKPRGNDEIELHPGDNIWLDVLHIERDGYSYGRNPRLGPRGYGRYPTYKVEDKIKIAKMPSYDGAKNFHL